MAACQEFPLQLLLWKASLAGAGLPLTNMTGDMITVYCMALHYLLCAVQSTRVAPGLALQPCSGKEL